MPKDRDITMLHGAPEPPAYLAERILRSIEREERNSVYRRITVTAACLVVFLGSSIASLVNLGAELSRSGFFSFASLFNSDFSFAVANIHELFLSLVESFPAISGAMCLMSIGLALWFSMRFLFEAGAIRHHSFFAAS
jgi:hypothetical protein